MILVKDQWLKPVIRVPEGGGTDQHAKDEETKERNMLTNDIRNILNKLSKK
jgi:hypothetical protein